MRIKRYEIIDMDEYTNIFIYTSSFSGFKDEEFFYQTHGKKFSGRNKKNWIKFCKIKTTKAFGDSENTQAVEIEEIKNDKDDRIKIF